MDDKQTDTLDSYQLLSFAASEATDEEYTADFDQADWKRYALSLAHLFLALDEGLTHGGDFPERWYLGTSDKA